MKAYVDQETCIGCGLCEGAEPRVFRMNDEGKAEGYTETTPDTQAGVDEAIAQCPVGAIEER